MYAIELEKQKQHFTNTCPLHTVSTVLRILQNALNQYVCTPCIMSQGLVYESCSVREMYPCSQKHQKIKLKYQRKVCFGFIPNMINYLF